jgi:outer membrane receptor protein involved in Fe transport
MLLMKTQHAVIARSIAALAAALVVTGATAQETPRMLEETVVTAQKREQALMDVPLSVQAITAEDLATRGTTDYSDLLQIIPSASFVSATAPGFETIQMRGIASGTTGDATVAYYVDDVAFGIPNLQIAPPARFYDLERLEIIRGPQGTLYGQGAMGGMIKFVTNAPDLEAFDFKVRGSASSTDGGDGNYNTDAVINAPVVDGKFGLRISGGYEDLGGFADAPDYPGKDVNSAELSNIRTRALWLATDSLSVSGSYWHIKADQDFNNTFSNEINKPTIINTFGIKGFTNTEVDTGDLTLDWELPFADLISASGYTEHKLDFVYPLDTSGFPSSNDSTFKTDSFTQEIRLVSNDEQSAWNWVAGAYYRDATVDNDILYLIDVGLGSIDFPVINQTGDLSTESYNIFGELSRVFLDDKLTALVGLSYFEDTRKTTDGKEYLDLDRTLFLRVPGDKATFDSTNPRFNLMYSPSDNGNVFLNVAKGFRSGTIQTQASVDAAEAIGVPTSTGVDPDEVWSYEVGTKWQLADNSVLVEAAVYYSDWKDIQIQFPTGGVIALANGGDADIYGIDLALVWATPLDGLNVQFSGNYNESEFSRVDPGISLSVPTIAKGEQIPLVPQSNASLSADYSWDIGGGLTGFAFAAYSYRDSQINTSGEKSGEPVDVRARLGVGSEHWTATLFGNNLLNDDDAVLISAVGGVQRQILRPLSVGIELEYRM